MKHQDIYRDILLNIDLYNTDIDITTYVKQYTHITEKYNMNYLNLKVAIYLNIASNMMHLIRLLNKDQLKMYKNNCFYCSTLFIDNDVKKMAEQSLIVFNILDAVETINNFNEF